MADVNGTTETAMVQARAPLATPQQPQVAASWIPRSFAQVAKLASIVVTSGLAPRAVQTKEAAFVIIMTGLELGLGVMQALRHISVIDGKPCLSAALIVSRVKRSSECRYFRIVSMTNIECTCETHRAGEPEPTRLTWTIDDAKTAGLTGKDNWKKYPRAMLRNRCQAELSRAVYPDAVDGMYDPDELGAITSEDGEIIEMPAQPRAVPPPPPPPPPPPSEPKAAAPSVDLDALTKVFEQRIGALVQGGGTKAELKSIGLEIAKSALDKPRRDRLAEVYDMALALIDAPKQREPGEEG